MISLYSLPKPTRIFFFPPRQFTKVDKHKMSPSSLALVSLSLKWEHIYYNEHRVGSCIKRLGEGFGNTGTVICTNEDEMSGLELWSLEVV